MISRREVFARLAMIASGMAATTRWRPDLLRPADAVAHPTRVTYGYVDSSLALVRGYLPAQVTVNGRDVSRDCIACDDQAGYVVLLDDPRRLDAHTRRVATRVIHGRVIFHPHNRAVGP